MQLLRLEPWHRHLHFLCSALFFFFFESKQPLKTQLCKDVMSWERVWRHLLLEREPFKLAASTLGVCHLSGFSVPVPTSKYLVFCGFAAVSRHGAVRCGAWALMAHHPALVTAAWGCVFPREGGLTHWKCLGEG